MMHSNGIQLPRGVFIVFEGGEGAGKSTQSKYAEEYFRSKGFLVHWTREPFDKDIRAKVLGLSQELGRPLTVEEELHEFCKDREKHVASVITPKLEEGHIVICDRFEDSTVVYQGHARCGGDEEYIRYIREKSAKARQGIEPDLVLLHHIDPEIGIARKHAGSDELTRFDKEHISFHRKVNDGFLKEAEKSLVSRTKGSWKWFIIDASKEKGMVGEDPSKKTVWQDTKRCIDDFFFRQFGVDLEKL